MRLNNIFIFNIHKAGSTFFRQLFTNLGHFDNFKQFNWETTLKNKIFESYMTPSYSFVPDNTISYQTCCSYTAFKDRIFHKGSYKGIYIYRDPRELLVSTYYSWYVSHPGGHPFRADMHNLQGEIPRWKYVIDRVGEEQGIFYSMADWAINCKDPNIKILKFIDIFQSKEKNLCFLLDMFKYFNINISEEQIKEVFNKICFENQTGRERGSQDINSHFRSCKLDSWKSEIPEKALEYFLKRYGALLPILEIV